MRRKIWGLGLAVLCWGSVAGAQVEVAAPPPPSPEKHRQAQQNLAAGQRLLKRERFEEALGKLQAAYADEPSGAALLGIALAERETDRLPESYRSYEKVLGEHAAELTPDERDRAQRALAELDAVSGAVKLTVTEPDAAYAVDNRPLDADTLARPLHLSGGRHVLGVTKPGYEQLIFPVWITVGKVLETSLTFKPLVGAAPARSAPPPAPAAPPPPTRPSAPPPAPVPVAPPPTAFPVAPPPPPPAPVPVAPPPPPPAPFPVAPPAPAPSTPAPVPVAPPPVSVPPQPAPAPIAPPVVPLQSPVPPVQVAPLAPVGPPPPRDAPGAPPPPPEGGSADAIRVGFLLGLVTLPRPLEGELVVKLGPSFALGLKGSLLPELSVPGIEAKLDLSAIEGIARWFPGNGLFFLGAGFGYQNFKASLGDIVDSSVLIISADMSGFFVQPQLGFLWVTQSGFAVSLSFGVQIPIPKDPVVTATYQGQPVPTQATGMIPQDVVDEANLDRANVQSVARFIVKYPFPTLDLLRIGIFF
jgi:hypothetical protein